MPASLSTSKVSSNWYYHFRCMWPGMLRLPKITSLLFLCNILRKKWVMKLKSLQIDTMILMGMVKHSQSSQNSKFAMSLQYLKKEVKDEVDFLHADKHQSFLKVYFNTLGIKVSYKVDIIIINGHDQAFSNYSK